MFQISFQEKFKSLVFSVAVRRSRKTIAPRPSLDRIPPRHVVPLGTLLSVYCLVLQKCVQPSAGAAEDVESAKREQ